eukprot:TRINITY_DN29940_c0_g1_i1.p1 TRINITY_DN29940_c0_g1~~TRINITY_DN29940_c0_g1_i1.p1  ORF type:complete len:673 (-),score=50.01 TRINITY_DN29940_c0_g1_i1:96-2114(-)
MRLLRDSGLLLLCGYLIHESFGIRYSSDQCSIDDKTEDFTKLPPSWTNTSQTPWTQQPIATRQNTEVGRFGSNYGQRPAYPTTAFGTAGQAQHASGFDQRRNTASSPFAPTNYNYQYNSQSRNPFDRAQGAQQVQGSNGLRRSNEFSRTIDEALSTPRAAQNSVATQPAGFGTAGSARQANGLYQDRNMLSSTPAQQSRNGGQFGFSSQGRSTFNTSWPRGGTNTTRWGEVSNHAYKGNASDEDEFEPAQSDVINSFLKNSGSSDPSFGDHRFGESEDDEEDDMSNHYSAVDSDEDEFEPAQSEVILSFLKNSGSDPLFGDHHFGDSSSSKPVSQTDEAKSKKRKSKNGKKFEAEHLDDADFRRGLSKAIVMDGLEPRSALSSKSGTWRGEWKATQMISNPHVRKLKEKYRRARARIRDIARNPHAAKHDLQFTLKQTSESSYPPPLLDARSWEKRFHSRDFPKMPRRYGRDIIFEVPSSLDGRFGSMDNVMLRTSSFAEVLNVRLKKRYNEVVLFHGVSSRTVADSILKDGFMLPDRNDRKFAKDRSYNRYGPGVYFSDALNKVLQYAKADDSDKRYIVVSKVSLGTRPYLLPSEYRRTWFSETFFCTPDVVRSVMAVKGFTSLIADLEDQEDDRQGFKEFVVFDRDAILPLYILEVDVTLEDDSEEDNAE